MHWIVDYVIKTMFNCTGYIFLTPAFITQPIWFTGPLFFSENKTQSNEISIISVSLLGVVIKAIA